MFMTSNGRPDLTLYQPDQQNTGNHHRESFQRGGNLRQTSGNQTIPAPMGWSTSAQAANPLQSGPVQQGSPTRRQQSSFDHTGDDFLGGFVLPGNSNDIPTSPTTPSPPSSAFSPQSNSAQRRPTVVSPTLEDDEYV